MSETGVIPSEFQIMDEADNEQILKAESAIKQALAYNVRGKKQLSYMGIKWLVLKMSQKEQPLEIVDMPQVELSKIDSEDKTTWVWYCTIKVRNLKTGLVTVGASETTYLYNGVYDNFGRTKAISKAERNAYRKQIPEIEINAMLNSILPEDIQSLNSHQDVTPAPVDQHYLDILKNIGYTGVQPKTSFEAAQLIGNLKKTKDSEDYCHCTNPITSGINSTLCQTCNLKLEDV